MTARTHDLAALLSLEIVALSRPLPVMTLATALIALLANQIGGIVPDIDQPTAPVWRNLPIGGMLGRIIDKGFGGHRFLTHSLLGLIIFGALAHALLSFLTPIMHGVNTGYIWWAFIIGMVSHLVMDSLTKEGVPWLLPLPLKLGLPPLKKLRFTTGKVGETLLIFPVLLLTTVWLSVSHYAMLDSFLRQIR